MSAPPLERARWWAAAGAVTLAVALFFSPALLGAGQFLYRDAGRAYHPEKHWLAAQLRQGSFPEWNPHTGLGAPVVAGAIAAVQHPLNLLFLALPFERAFTLWVVLCYLVAGLGMLAWTRALGLGAASGCLAALAFALSGFLVSSSDNLIHLASMSAAPWLLAAACAYAARGGRARLAGLAAASFLCAAGGETLDWAVAVGLAAVQLALAPGPGGRAARAWRTAAGVAAALVGAAPIVVPFLAFLGESSRREALGLAEAARWNLHPLRVAELAVPGLVRGTFGAIRNDVYVFLTGDGAPTPWTLSLYAGAPVVALAILGAARRPAARLLLAGAAALTWLAMGHRGGLGGLLAHLPVLASVRYFERLMGWPTLLLAAAAAYGAEQLRADRAEAHPAGRFALASAVAGAVALAVAAAARLAPDALVRAAGAPDAVGRALVANLGDGTLAAGGALCLLALLAWAGARAQLARLAPAALALLVAADLFGANARAYVLAAPETLFGGPAPIPERLAAHPEIGRVTSPFALDRERWPELLSFESSWRWGARTAAASFHLEWEVASFDAYAGVFPARLARFLARRGVAERVVPAGLVGVGAVAVPHALQRAAEVGLAPPWRVLAEDPALPAWLVAVPHRPRAYLARELVSVDAEGALAFLAAAEPARELRTAVEGPVPAGYAPPEGTARVVADGGDRVEVEADATGPVLLVLDDQLLAGWTAEVDGREAPIVAANYLVRGVWLEPGRHRVTFRYRTPLWRESWAAVAIAALGLVRVRRRRGPAAPSHGG